MTEPKEKGITTYPAVLGAILMNLRNDLGRTQLEIAQSSDVKKSTWSRIEKGESSISVEQLVFAARALGVSAATIVDLAEAAVKALRAQGIRVERSDQQSNWNISTILSVGLLPVSGQALSVLIAGVAAYRKLEKTAKSQS